MSTYVLYIITVLIWGTTWIAIKFQVGAVASEISVAYRFALAAFLLLSYCIFTRRRIRYSWNDHAFMALQGILMFSINYLLFYQATKYLTTGLLAVIFSTIVFMNILGQAVFFKASVEPRVAVGAILGLIGIVLVFWQELTVLGFSREPIMGTVLGLVATFFASLGNMTAVRNRKRGLPVVQINAFGMAYGAAFMVLVAVFNGHGFSFDFSPAYIASLLYLAVFGSIFAFGSYLTLLSRIGADRAAYANVLFPIVALGISTWFEGFQWSKEALVGFVIVLIGNLVVLADFRGLLTKVKNRKES